MWTDDNRRLTISILIPQLSLWFRWATVISCIRHLEKLISIRKVLFKERCRPQNVQSELHFVIWSRHAGQLCNQSLHSMTLLVWFDSLRPINNLSVKQGWVFLEWTSTKLGYMCLAQGPQRSDTGEAQTRGLSVSSQALYHWATALPALGDLWRRQYLRLWSELRKKFNPHETGAFNP